MRIIAGKYRGKTLAEFRGMDIRPTPDRVKESVFQILSDRLVGAHVLDLFAGSGALGIEALSRGASEVQFNDLSRDSLAVCRKNLAAVKERGILTQLDFRTCLMRAEGKFDIVFCDPPYREQFTEEILGILYKRALLRDDGIVVAESERCEEAPDGWEVADFRSYGRTKITFLMRKQL